MTKDRFRSLIRRARLTQREVAVDLGLAESTVVRWPEEAVPRYAALYALVMLDADDEKRAAWRAEISEVGK